MATTAGSTDSRDDEGALDGEVRHVNREEMMPSGFQPTIVRGNQANFAGSQTIVTGDQTNIQTQNIIVNVGNQGEERGDESNSTSSIGSFDVDICRKELSRVYEDERGKVSTLPFDVEGVVDIDDIFVNLELLEESFFPNEVKRVQLKTYDDLFCLPKKPDQGKLVLRVLLKGGPGSGKTTLAAKIAYDWAKCKEEKSSQGVGKFQLLFVLNMRYIDQNMSLVDAIFDQLLPTDSQISRNALEEYIIQHAGQVAVILDGADEFSGKIEKSRQGNLIGDIVCNRMLCNSCIVVTTRPHKAAAVKEFSQYSHVEVTGFSKESSFQFIGKFFKVKPYTREDEFFHQLIDDRIDEDNSFQDTSRAEGSVDEKSVDSLLKTVYRSASLKSFSCIPVILTMLCIMWKEAQKLPERVTVLYQEMIHYFTQRWLEKQNEDTDSEDIESNILLELGKVAHKCLLEDRLFFSAKEFKFPDILEKACSIGILLQDRKRSRLRVLKQYTFFHKTFQEFCAASYLASLAGEFPVMFTRFLSRINSRNVDSFEYMLLFCCGLSSKAARMILSHTVKIGTSDVISENRCVFRLPINQAWCRGLHLLNESRSCQLVKILLAWFSAPTIEIWISTKISKEILLSLDYFLDCFGQSLSSNNSGTTYLNVVLEISFDTIKDETTRRQYSPYSKGEQSDIQRMSTIVRFLSQNSHELLNLTFVIKSDFEESVQMTYQLMETISWLPFKDLDIVLATNAINSTFLLNASPKGIGKQERDRRCAVMMRKLGLNIGQFLSQSFRTLRISAHFHLDITEVLIGINNSTFLRSITGFKCAACTLNGDVLVSFVSKLTRLNWISIEQHMLIGNMVMRRNQMKYDFKKPLNPKSIPKFLQTIESLKHVTVLDICGPCLGYSIVHIQRLLANLSYLSLRNTQMDRHECVSLFSYLSLGNERMEYLNIQGNSIGGSYTFLTWDSKVYIPIRNSFTRFESSYCKLFLWLSKALGLLIVCERSTVQCLVDAFRHLPLLRELNLCSTSLTPQDIGCLYEGFKHLTLLETVDLSCNRIGNACMYLSPGLKRSRYLIQLNLQEAELFDTGAIALSRTFQHLQSLEHIDISRNRISFKGLYELSRSFHQLPRLSRLLLSNNSIGDLGVLALCTQFQIVASLSGSHLKQLDIDDCFVTKIGILLLALSFRYLPNLTVLSLSKNTIGPFGTRWLLEKIHELPNLLELSVEDIIFPFQQCDEHTKLCVELLKWEKWEPIQVTEDTRYVQLKKVDVHGIQQIVEVFKT